MQNIKKLSIVLLVLFSLLFSGVAAATSTGCRVNSPYTVYQVQKALQSKGYSVSADGIMGSQTCGAIKNFQSSRGLVADGIVGPATASKLGLSTTSTSTTTSSGNTCLTTNKAYRCSFVDVSAKRMIRYEAGRYLTTWTINTGMSSNPTPTGTYWTGNSCKGGCKATTNEARMYSYVKFGSSGAAVHGSYNYPYPSGLNVSHGCIHVSWANADTFYYWGGNGRSKIVIVP